MEIASEKGMYGFWPFVKRLVWGVLWGLLEIQTKQRRKNLRAWFSDGPELLCAILLVQRNSKHSLKMALERALPPLLLKWSRPTACGHRSCVLNYGCLWDFPPFYNIHPDCRRSWAFPSFSDSKERVTLPATLQCCRFLLQGFFLQTCDALSS